MTAGGKSELAPASDLEPVPQCAGRPASAPFRTGQPTQIPPIRESVQVASRGTVGATGFEAAGLGAALLIIG